MNLEEALSYTELKESDPNKRYNFDGCTMAPELGIRKFCIMHDTLRTYRPNGMSAWEADKLFFQGICTKGKRYWLIACIYWSAVRIQAYVGFKGLSVLGVVILATILVYFKR